MMPLKKYNILFKEKMSALERFLENDTRRKVLFWLLVAITFAAIYLLNVFQPYFSDDFAYLFKWDNWKLNNRIAGFEDIVQSQYRHYFEWGGRSVAHAILQFLLWKGEVYGDLLNSLMYVVYIVVIYRIACLKSERKYNIRLFLVISLLIWFLQFSFGDAVLWLTGSLNYLWMTTFALLFLYPLCKLHVTGKTNMSLLKAIPYFLGGVAAGWSNENTAVTCVAFVIILFFLWRKEKRKIPGWTKIGFAGLLVGTSLLLLAPGNFVRLSAAMAAHGGNDTSILFRLCYNVLKTIWNFFHYGLPTTITVVFLFILHRFFGERKQNRDYSIAAVFIASAIIGLLSMAAVGALFAQRVWFGIITFSVVASAVLYADLDFGHRFVAVVSRAASGLFLCLLCTQYTLGAMDLWHIRQVFAANEQKVYEQKRQGIMDVVLPPDTLDIKTNLPRSYQLTADSTMDFNRKYAGYYGVRTVRVACNVK